LQGEFEEVVLFADEQNFTSGVVDFLDEVEDVEVLIEGVEALELALDAAEQSAALGVRRGTG
jgi:DNA-binding NarL/FixJ family response regulator